jgi:hypothetical protein
MDRIAALAAQVEQLSGAALLRLQPGEPRQERVVALGEAAVLLEEGGEVEGLRGRRGRWGHDRLDFVDRDMARWQTSLGREAVP